MKQREQEKKKRTWSRETKTEETNLKKQRLVRTMRKRLQEKTAEKEIAFG